MPRKIDRSERDATIQSLLAGGPYSTQELERRVGRWMNMVLPALARKGVVKQCTDHRWALPDFDEATLAEYPFIDPRFTSSQEGNGKALRHAHERPPHIRLKKDEPLPWWATAPRVGFTRLAEANEQRMRHAPENKFVAHRMLQ